MYHVVEPLPYSGHSLHGPVVFGLHTMESLLQTLVPNMLNATHQTQEVQEQDNDAVLNMRSLLHTAGLDGVDDTTQLASHYVFHCSCAGQTA